jgi:hypothetical protein
MSDAQLATVPLMSEPLTWKQICERYPDEWVALVEIDWLNDTDFEFGTARVVGHGKTRREHYEQARAWSSQYASMGHFFTGRVRAPICPLLFP